MGADLRRRGVKVAVHGNIGYQGYNAGPGVHIIDPLSLGDAFVARLPVVPGPWRIGHFARELPPGYVDTIQTGRNQIQDPRLAEYYDHLHTVTSDDLFSWRRYKEVFLFNVGAYEYLIPRRKTN